MTDLKLRGMVVKRCRFCGHRIGEETGGGPEGERVHLYYDEGEWERPIETCPSCGNLLEPGALEFSPAQREQLHDTYTLLLHRARKKRKGRGDSKAPS